MTGKGLQDRYKITSCARMNTKRKKEKKEGFNGTIFR